MLKNTLQKLLLKHSQNILLMMMIITIKYFTVKVNVFIINSLISYFFLFFFKILFNIIFIFVILLGKEDNFEYFLVNYNGDGAILIDDGQSY